ncbi:MAG: HdeA family protein [Proteobacteria bacterium]|nr:HdeA family protein [Pseudomonadota bacterium]
MRIALAALALLAGAALTTAKAEVIDLATIKCSEIASMPDEEGSYLMIWIHGYFSGQAGSTTMDLDDMAADGKAIGEYCAANPDVGVLSAAQQALGN